MSLLTVYFVLKISLLTEYLVPRSGTACRARAILPAGTTSAASTTLPSSPLAPRRRRYEAEPLSDTEGDRIWVNVLLFLSSFMYHLLLWTSFIFPVNAWTTERCVLLWCMNVFVNSQIHDHHALDGHLVHSNTNFNTLTHYVKPDLIRFRPRTGISRDIPVRKCQSVRTFQYTIFSQYGYSSPNYSISKDIPVQNMQS